MFQNDRYYTLNYKSGEAIMSKLIYSPTEKRAVILAHDKMIVLARYVQGAQFISLIRHYDRRHFPVRNNAPIPSKVAAYAGYSSNRDFNNYLLSLYAPAN